MEPGTRRLHGRFIERPDLTKAIDSCFFPEDRGGNEIRTVSSFLLYGMPGNGKSQLAHYYFKQRVEKYINHMYNRVMANQLQDSVIDSGLMPVLRSRSGMILRLLLQ